MSPHALAPSFVFILALALTPQDDKGGAPEHVYSPWHAWKSFAMGSSTVVESVDESGQRGRVWSTTELVEKQPEALEIKVSSYIDADLISTKRHRIEPPPSYEKCSACGKARHRWTVVREKETVKTKIENRPEMECTLIELALCGVGREAETHRYWINKEVPGWVVKSAVVRDGKEIPRTLLAGFTAILTISGTLKHPDIEGGVWIVKHEGVEYDLHGDLAGFKAGDEVEVTGRVARDRVCAHMRGVIFEVQSIRKRPQR